jgi:hypothetical protein
MCTWKCHRKTPYAAILNKQKRHLENRRAEQVLSGEVDISGRRKEGVGG